ncbi:MAG: hypothetical protein RLZ12_104 [Bacillota bacterium]|jgi:hypothetical protein
MNNYDNYYYPEYYDHQAPTSYHYGLDNDPYLHTNASILGSLFGGGGGGGGGLGDLLGGLTQIPQEILGGLTGAAGNLFGNLANSAGSMVSNMASGAITGAAKIPLGILSPFAKLGTMIAGAVGAATGDKKALQAAQALNIIGNIGSAL